MSIKEQATAGLIQRIVNDIQDAAREGLFELDLNNNYDKYSSDLDDAIIGAVNDPDFKIKHGIASW